MGMAILSVYECVMGSATMYSRWHMYTAVDTHWVHLQKANGGAVGGACR